MSHEAGGSGERLLWRLWLPLIEGAASFSRSKSAREIKMESK